MSNEDIQKLVDRYVDVSFSVTKKAEALITEQLGSNLTHDQLYILRYINRVGSCTSTALSDEFEVKKSAITAIINRLWEKGFILRTRDEKDRRVVYLALTEKGEDLFWKIDERIHHLVQGLISQFEPSEIVQFIETYEKLNHVLIDLKNKS
ncbi:MarR family transcriptional regulator [Robertmurraya massiliosenegalensis]|uniref:MarR family winged helix-turn-helix transcriptional regulator n=1 Tax=Robertmurraya TaxID=2837507 RepID=UPI0039A573FB